MKKCFIICLVITVLIVLTSCSNSKDDLIEVNSREDIIPNNPITFVENEDNVMKYYNDKIHGMERGQKEGCYVDIGKTAVLPDNLGIINFNKIWYTKDCVYVFYSLTPSDSIQLKEVAQIGGRMIWNNNKNISSGANLIMGLKSDEWVSCNGRYYSVMCFSNVKERINSSNTEPMVELNLNLELSYKDNNAQQVVIKVPEVSFSIMYYPSMDKSYTVDLNKEIRINSQTEIIFLQLIMESQSSFLIIKLNSEIGNELNSVSGLLSTDKDETVQTCLYMEKIEGGNNDYKIKLDAINRLPSDIKITLQEVELVTDNSLKFELNVTKYHGEFLEAGQGQAEQLNKIIGGIGDKIEFTLEKIYWSNKGVELIINRGKQTEGFCGILP